MTIKIYIEYKIYKFLNETKSEFKNPKNYIALLIIFGFYSYINQNFILGILSIVGIAILLIVADIMKGEHIYWYRKQYRKKIMEASENERGE